MSSAMQYLKYKGLMMYVVMSFDIHGMHVEGTYYSKGPAQDHLMNLLRKEVA